jgi:DNA polymerase III epsilon subunit-like protein
VFEKQSAVANPNRLIALDIETTGLHPWKDEILCIGVWSPTYNRVYRGEQGLKEFYQNWNQTYRYKEIVGHNLKFDLKFLQVAALIQLGDFTVGQIHDTQVLAHTIKEKIPQAWLDQYEQRRQEENKKLPKRTHEEEKEWQIEL